MEEKNKALDGALGSTKIEGIDLSEEVANMINEALNNSKQEKSFLYELVEKIKEQDSDVKRK